MGELELEHPVRHRLTQFLEKIDRIAELDRILHSMWTKIRGNKIISLDLSRLGLRNSDLENISNSLFNDLEYLYLQGNDLEVFDGKLFSQISSIRGLNLPNNTIDRFENGDHILPKIEWINLSSNHLKELKVDDLQCFEHLQSLNLSHNTISRIKPKAFSALFRLEKLNLSNNAIIQLEGNEFSELNNLEILNLQANKIIKIADDLPASLPKLEKLYLKHNPGFTLHNTFETRFEILEIFRTKTQEIDRAMTELLNFEDEEIIATFNQLLEDPRWDGGIGRVSNYKLSQVIGMSIETIARKIETLITQKKLHNIVHFDNNDPMSFEKHYWIRPSQSKDSINTGINEPKCLWCNTELTDPFDACPTCGLRCEICKFSIKQTQEFDVCTAESDQACRDIFHRSEFMEWVRIYGTCPKCSQDINLNLYQVSQDYSRKVGSLVEQDMELPSNQSSNDFLVPMALAILIDLKGIKSNVTTSEEMLKQLGKEAREQHQEILKELQPLATEIVLITAFLNRLEAKTLTEESFKASIEHISDRFAIFEDNIDIIFEAHQKDKTKMEKIKELTSKGGIKGATKGGEVGVKALVERVGLKEKIKAYVKFPTKEALKSILGRIGHGIRDKAGDPTTWIKLGAAFLLI